MQSLREIAPAVVLNHARILVHKFRGMVITLTDHKRFHRFSAPAGSARNSSNRRSLIMYYTHSLEKGLSHYDFRPRFGLRAISSLSILLNQWESSGEDRNDVFYVSACATLKKYFTKHAEISIDVSDRLSMLSETVQNDVMGSSSPGGTKKVVFSHSDSFSTILKQRVSIRNFSSESVDIEELQKCIIDATHSPSACNRQSTRVHCIFDNRMINQLLSIQAGLGGYPRPPLLLLITSDASSYVEATERNQPFVDGALFAMTLIYSLEAAGYGTCPLTAMLWPKNEKSVRKLLGIPPSEFFVTFIAVGRKPSEAIVPFSARETLESIVKYY